MGSQLGTWALQLAWLCLQLSCNCYVLGTSTCVKNTSATATTTSSTTTSTTTSTTSTPTATTTPPLPPLNTTSTSGRSCSCSFDKTRIIYFHAGPKQRSQVRDGKQDSGHGQPSIVALKSIPSKTFPEQRLANNHSNRYRLLPAMTNHKGTNPCSNPGHGPLIGIRSEKPLHFESILYY